MKSNYANEESLSSLYKSLLTLTDTKHVNNLINKEYNQYKIGYGLNTNSVARKEIDKNSSRIHENNIINEEAVKKLQKKLERLISNDVFEVGYESKSSIYFKKQLEENSIVAKQSLQKCYVDNYQSSHMIYGVLSIISDIDYNDIYPEGQAIVLGGGSHMDDDVKEATVRVFENWCNEQSLELIQNIRFSDEWLDDYRLQVIEDIKENL